MSIFKRVMIDIVSLHYSFTIQANPDKNKGKKKNASLRVVVNKSSSKGKYITFLFKIEGDTILK